MNTAFRRGISSTLLRGARRVSISGAIVFSSISKPCPYHALRSLRKDLHSSAAALLPERTKGPLPKKFSELVASSNATKTVPESTGGVTNPRGFAQRMKLLIQEYGAYALCIYAGLWVVPLAAYYELFVVYDNFGYKSPEHILTYFGIKESVYEFLKLAPDATPEPWQLSALFAYLAADVSEVVRFPLTLFLAPRLKRWLQARGYVRTAEAVSDSASGHRVADGPDSNTVGPSTNASGLPPGRAERGE